MKFFYTFSLFIVLISCVHTPDLSNDRKDEIKNEVQIFLKSYHSAIAKNGLTAEFDYLDNSPDFFWVPPGYSSALNYDSIASILETNAKNFKKVQFSWKSLELFPLSNSIVNFSGIVNGEMTDLSGKTTQMSILESGTLIKRSEGWKLLSGQSRMLIDTLENKIFIKEAK